MTNLSADARPAYGAALSALEKLAQVAPNTYETTGFASLIESLNGTVATLSPIVEELDRRDRAKEADAARDVSHDGARFPGGRYL